jgi:protein-disulfide isomerase
MTSGKQARRQRQQAAARPPVRSTGGGRKASPKVLLGAAAGIAGIAVAIGLAVAFSGGSSSPSASTVSALPDSNAVIQLFKGIPQNGNVLGKPSAPVTMVEYIDLQCPVCRAFETETMPTIVDRYVRTGKVKVEARTIAFLGPDSVTGRLAAIAASKQNGLFDFAQLLYANQGPENGGWLDDTMIAAAAKSIPGVNVDALLATRDSANVAATAKSYDAQAKADAVGGTPALYIGKSGGKLSAFSPGSAPDVVALSAELDRALG